MSKRPDFSLPEGQPDFPTRNFAPEECGWAFGGYTPLGHVIYEKPDGEVHIFERGAPLLITKMVEE